MDMGVSVVVPTYNRVGQLAKLLHSFSKMNAHNLIEIIIVDDCSLDDTGKVVKEWCSLQHSFDTRYILMENNGGPAKARNKGILLSKGDVIAFTDSDCIVHPQWIKHLSDGLLSNDEYIGIGGRVLPQGNDIFSKYYTYHRILEPPISKKYLVSANCIYWRESVVKVDGFDEGISKPGGEDIGLSFNLYNNGHRFGFEEKAIVYHDYRPSIKDFSKTFYNYGMGCRIMTEKYFGGGSMV